MTRDEHELYLNNLDEFIEKKIMSLAAFTQDFKDFDGEFNYFPRDKEFSEWMKNLNILFEFRNNLERLIKIKDES